MTQAHDAPEEILDLSGIPCPANASRALLRLELLNPGDLLVLIVDDGEPLENVPEALLLDGHEIVENHPHGPGSWRLVVRRGDDD